MKYKEYKYYMEKQGYKFELNEDYIYFTKNISHYINNDQTRVVEVFEFDVNVVASFENDIISLDSDIVIQWIEFLDVGDIVPCFIKPMMEIHAEIENDLKRMGCKFDDRFISFNDYLK